MVRDLNQDSSFVYEQFEGGQASESLPVTLPLGTVFVSQVNGVSGSVTFGGGTTGLTFTPAGATVTLGGILAIANGGTGSGTAAGARTNLGIDAFATKKSNLSATVAPTVTDDSTAGYSVGSPWVDITADQVYMAVDVSVGAAVWVLLG